jgi:hypothetical protein
VIYKPYSTYITTDEPTDRLPRGKARHSIAQYGTARRGKGGNILGSPQRVVVGLAGLRVGGWDGGGGGGDFFVSKRGIDCLDLVCSLLSWTTSASLSLSVFLSFFSSRHSGKETKRKKKKKTKKRLIDQRDARTVFSVIVEKGWGFDLPPTSLDW